MKKIRTLLSVFVFIVVCFQFSVHEVNAGPKQAKKLNTVQINTAKIKVDDFGKVRANKLQTYVDQLLDTGDVTDAVTRDENYDTLCFHYEDGTKRLFMFFNKDGNWYMEGFGGNVYKEADFITEYIVHQKSDEKDAETAAAVIFTDTFALEVYQEFETYDLNYYFLNKMVEEINYGASEKEAVERVRKKLRDIILLYKYSVNNGFEYTSDEISKLLEEHITNIESTENYDSFQKIFADNKITYREYAQKSKKLFEVYFTIKNLYQTKREEFRHGNDMIDGKVCENLETFWSEFLNSEVYVEMELYDLSELENQLREAEDFYYSNKDRLVK